MAELKGNQFNLVIISPERQFYNAPVERVTFRTTEGDLGVLRGHIPLTVGLSSGHCKIQIDANTTYIGVIHGGFAEIQPEKVTILVDAAEWPDEIDVERAKRRMRRAEEILSSASADDLAIKRARYSMLKQMARIELTSMKEGTSYRGEFLADEEK